MILWVGLIIKKTQLSLLSLLSLSYIVALIRELVNKSFLSTSKAFLSYRLVQSLTNINLDINMATSRGRSLSHQSYNSREFSVFLTTLSVPYHERIKYQNSNPSWSKQVETEVISLVIPGNLEQRTNTDIQISNNNLPVESQYVINKALVLNNTLSMYVEHEITVLVEINTQSTYYEVSLSYNIN